MWTATALVLYSVGELEQRNSKSSYVIWKETPSPQKNSIVQGIVKVRVSGFEQWKKQKQKQRGPQSVSGYSIPFMHESIVLPIM